MKTYSILVRTGGVYSMVLDEDVNEVLVEANASDEQGHTEVLSSGLLRTEAFVELDRLNGVITPPTVAERIRLTASVPALLEYAHTLIGPRTRGSTTVRPLTDYNEVEFKPLEDQSLAQPGTIMLSGTCPGIGGKEAAITLEEALEYADTSECGNWRDPLGGRVRYMKVGVRKGAHGYELYIAEGRDMVCNLVATDNVIMIVAGKDNPDGVPEGGLITWYPGRPMACATLPGNCGVKIS